MPEVKCNKKVSMHCDQIWHHLDTVDREKRIKHCEKCCKNVYWCSTIKDVQSHLSQGNCIAAHWETLDKVGLAKPFGSDRPIYIGDPDIPPNAPTYEGDEREYFEIAKKESVKT